MPIILLSSGIVVQDLASAWLRANGGTMAGKDSRNVARGMVLLAHVAWRQGAPFPRQLVVS